MGDGKTMYKTIEFHRGQTIFKEGHQGSCAYLIKSGVVNVYKIIHNKKVSLTQMTAGQILGEMSVINRDVRSASAEALEFCELIKIDESNLRHALDQSIPLVKGLTRQLISRCREKDDRECEQMTGNIFLSVCHLILILSRDQNIYYSHVSESIRNILCIPQLKIDRITEKLCNLKLLTLSKAHTHSDKIVCIEDPELFLKVAKAFDEETRYTCEQEDEYIDIFELAGRMESTPVDILKKIGNGCIPENLVFFSRAETLEWVEKNGSKQRRHGLPETEECHRQAVHQTGEQTG